MKSLLQSLESVERVLRSAHSIFIFSDYDGTLTPITDKPDRAVLSEKKKTLLRSLSENPRYKLAIVSARPSEDVQNLLRMKSVFYIGNHGLEIIGPSLHMMHPKVEAFIPLIDLVRKGLQKELDSIPGVEIEDKRLTLTVHYRSVAREKTAEIRRILRERMQKFDLIVSQGKKAYDIKPNIKWNKGDASRWLLEAVDRDALPIYMGDDASDEDAFGSLENGITILVSKTRRQSRAKYFLRSTTEVEKFLSHLLRLST